MSNKTRNWCLTCNNYEQDDIDMLFSYESHCTSITCGFEEGENGTPHLQCAISWIDAVTFANMKKKFAGWHIEIMKGTPQQGHSYCMKGENPKCDVWTHDSPGKNWKGRFCGTFPYGQGYRSDIFSIIQDLNKGDTTCDELILTAPKMMHQYGRTFEKCEDIRLRSIFRSEMTECTWFVGPSGSGKSHTAFANFDPATMYVWKNDKGWQDGYIQQETVIINDFRGSMLPYNELLCLVDKWPHSVSRRGRAPMPFTSKLIIITSILTPQQCYPNLCEKDGIEQLLRRVHVVEIPSRNKT